MLDRIRGILQSRHPAGAGEPQITIHPKLVSIIPLQDEYVEFMICVRESKIGLWTATRLYYELMQVEAQLKQNLGCEKIVPRTEIVSARLGREC